MACATVNYNALKATLERLRAEGVGVEGMRDRLRWIVATNHLAVGSAQRAAAAGVVDQKAVVVESQPWEGMRLVEWNRTAWRELPPKAFARTLYAHARRPLTFHMLPRALADAGWRCGASVVHQAVLYPRV
jgi:hypothetical protein